MKFVFVDNETEGGRVWIVEAPDKHNAIATAVENDYSEDKKDFYYGFEDGQISIYMIEKEIGPDEPPTPARASDAKSLDGKHAALELARNKLYEALPSGEVDAIALIKIIQTHIADLDKILEAS